MNSLDLYTDVPLHISVATIVKHAHHLLQVAADRDREEAKRMDREFCQKRASTIYRLAEQLADARLPVWAKLIEYTNAWDEYRKVQATLTKLIAP